MNWFFFYEIVERQFLFAATRVTHPRLHQPKKKMGMPCHGESAGLPFADCIFGKIAMTCRERKDKKVGSIDCSVPEFVTIFLVGAFGKSTKTT